MQSEAWRAVGRLVHRIRVPVPFESSLVQAAPDPVARYHQLNRLGTHLYTSLLRHLLDLPGGERTLVPTDVEWDHLVLLDACRWDTFQEVVGPCDPVLSPGSATREWAQAAIARNPRADRLRDVWLVTANPWHSREWWDLEGWPWPYAGCTSLWKEGVDEATGVVLPKTVARAAGRASEGGHRVFAHFAQPHFPPVTERLDIPDNVPNREMHLWDQIARGDVPLQRAYRLYQENLRAAWTWVRWLRDRVSGKLVVFSDHGNLFGEYGLYGHPEGFHVPELIQVPYLEVE